MYNPGAWYWVVAGSTTQVYSSAGAAYVAVSDSTYEAWLAAGGVPTRIGVEADLADVLQRQYPAGLGALGPRYVPLATIRDRVTAAGKWVAFATALDGLSSDKRWHLLTLAQGVASNDPDATALLVGIGCDAAAILAP